MLEMSFTQFEMMANLHAMVQDNAVIEEYETGRRYVMRRFCDANGNGGTAQLDRLDMASLRVEMFCIDDDLREEKPIRRGAGEVAVLIADRAFTYLHLAN